MKTGITAAVGNHRANNGNSVNCLFLILSKTLFLNLSMPMHCYDTHVCHFTGAFSPSFAAYVVAHNGFNLMIANIVGHTG